MFCERFRERGGKSKVGDKTTENGRLTATWQLAVLAFLLALSCALPGNCAAPELAARNGGDVVRELVDPCLGVHWQLRIDPIHPGWPGRIVMLQRSVNGGEGGNNDGGKKRSPGQASGSRSFPASSSTPIFGRGKEIDQALPVLIRSGDHVTVDQETEFLHAQFEALALESVGLGQRIRVRLMAGTHKGAGFDGEVITGIAIGARQVRWRAL